MMTSNTTQTNHSVNSSSFSVDFLDDCFQPGSALYILLTIVATRTLIILPLSILVLYLGLQRWRRQRSFDTTSHTDIFTYNMAATELVGTVGGLVVLCGIFTGHLAVEVAGHFLAGVAYPGQLFFHVLTCVERYLAVVHPITYMGLRQSGGARIRNISIVCVWLLSFGWRGAISINHITFSLVLVSLTFSTIVVSFCSLRVLCVLIRPGPGEVGGARERVDQSKQRAFYTIMIITAVLWLWLSGSIICFGISSTRLFSYSVLCAVGISAHWFMFPGSLVSPLLFLHRAGKLTFCC